MTAAKKTSAPKADVSKEVQPDEVTTVDWRDPARRALRTFLQTFVGALLIALLPFSAAVAEWASGDAAFPGFTALGAGAVAALVAGVVAVVSYVQNWLEDNTKWPTLLK